MADPTAEIDFANPEALGHHLIGRLQAFAKTESIVPGTTAEWALMIGNTVFRMDIRVDRSAVAS